MSTGRVLWIIWCCAWMAFWVLGGLYVLGAARASASCQLFNQHCGNYLIPAFGFVMGASSVAAIAIPVGKAGTAS
jgi:hypothetical protein